MRTFNFTIVAAGVDFETEGFEDTFFEAGCDDAIIAVQRGALTLEFDREAETFNGALTSALENVRAAGAKVVRVEPDTLVSMSEAARRTGLSRGAMSNYVRAERGERFPAPVARVLSDSPLWDWVQVAEWLTQQRDPRVSDEMLDEARAIKRATQELAQIPLFRSVSITPTRPCRAVNVLDWGSIGSSSIFEVTSTTFKEKTNV